MILVINYAFVIIYNFHAFKEKLFLRVFVPNLKSILTVNKLQLFQLLNVLAQLSNLLLLLLWAGLLLQLLFHSLIFLD
jgi:hypothetical protein